MGEADCRHLLGQGLDEMNMAAGDDRFDGADHQVVVEHALDIVVNGERGRLHVYIHGEAHALGDTLLLGVDADLHVEHEVVYEDAIVDRLGHGAWVLHRW